MTQLSKFPAGIPIVANATERDALYPTPPLNFRVDNLATGTIQGWNGTSWVDRYYSGSLSSGTPAIQDEGVTVVALPTAVDFRGAGVEVVAVGSVARVNITAGGGVNVSEDGVPVVGAASTVDFLDNFTVTEDGGTAEVQLSGISEGVVPMGGPGGVGLVDAPLRASDLYGLLVGGLLPSSPMAEARVETLSSLANGDPVTTWGSFTAVNSPTYRTADTDGLPYVEFDGTNDYLDITTPASYTGKEVLMLLVLQPTWPATGTTNPISVTVAGENQSQSGDRPILELVASGARYNMQRAGSGFPAFCGSTGSGDQSKDYCVIAVRSTLLTLQDGSGSVRISLRTPAFPFWSLGTTNSDTTFDRVRLGAAYANFANPGNYAKMRLRYAGVWTGGTITDKQVWSAIRYLQSTYLAD